MLWIIETNIFLHVFVSPWTAIKNNHYDLASLLLRYNATVDQKGSLQRTALHEASLLGLEDYVYQLLQAGANPDACDSNEHTPLGLAAQAGRLNVVEILLQKGYLSFLEPLWYHCLRGNSHHFSSSLNPNYIICHLRVLEQQQWLFPPFSPVAEVMWQPIKHEKMCESN